MKLSCKKTKEGFTEIVAEELCKMACRADKFGCTVEAAVKEVLSPANVLPPVNGIGGQGWLDEKAKGPMTVLTCRWQGQ
jgi:hypothetical protein